MHERVKLRLLILASLLALCFGALRAGGFVDVRNFTHDSYKGGPQNWMSVSDSLGRVYFGNRDGMLEFDGIRWRKYVLPNRTAVRSLLLDPASDAIYVGGSEEFGRFSPDSISGRPVYSSLSQSFVGQRPQFSEVWNILDHDGSIWFQTDYQMLRYNGGDIAVHPFVGRISHSAVAGGRLYVAFEDGSLFIFGDYGFRPLAGAEALKGTKIAAILPFPGRNTLLIVTAVDGLYEYDGSVARPFQTEISRFLKDNQVFCAAVHGDDVVFGTVNNGAVIRNFRTGDLSFINKDAGLRNNTVLSASFTHDGNIWLSLDNGLAYADYASPLHNITGASSSAGAGYASLRRNDKVYLGTNQGLYSTAFPLADGPTPVSMHRELRGQIWALDDYGDGIFAACDAGIFVNAGAGFTKIDGIGGAYRAVVLPADSSMALASAYDGFHLLRRKGRTWVNEGPLSGYNGPVGNFGMDRFGNVWLAHWLKGIYRLRIDTRAKSVVETDLYDADNGLPASSYNSVDIVDGSPVIVARTGFYTYDHPSRKLLPEARLDSIFPTDAGGRLYRLADGDLVFMTPRGLYMLPAEADRTSLRFIPYADKTIPGFEHASLLDDSTLLMANEEGFRALTLRNGNHPAADAPQAYVGRVYANGDSLVYRAGVSKQTPVLPYTLNSLRFDFSYPDYRLDVKPEFSSMLVGYDRDWTPFSPETGREYTRLGEGSYTLRLRCRDTATGALSESTFGFAIEAPWYRTLWMKIVYACIALLLIAAAYFFVRRFVRDARRQVEVRKERELRELRRRAEQEALVKDYEIATLKSEQLEQDIRHKSDELSNNAMSLIRKNEILREIADRVAKIRSNPAIDAAGQPISRQLARIMTVIEENISHDDDWKAFNRNFDLVYHDFTRKIMELHPDLSVSDKRLCCYIRMGLSSKEIAPLLNISYKSVEMARYRLRRKMDLPPQTALSDYLSRINI